MPPMSGTGPDKFVIATHDNLIIRTVSLSEHDRTSRNVSERAKDCNIKFNLKKIQLRVPKVKYLGNIVSKEGLKPDPEKVMPIFEIPQPENIQEAQQILGVANYLGQYIPNLCEISCPLWNLLKKGINCWHWSLKHSKVLKEKQTILTAEQVLSFFDTKCPIEIQIDASSCGLGACLMQNKHALSYSCSSLTNTEKNFAQIEKELLAIVHACKKFNQFAYGQPTFVKSYHKPVESIIGKCISPTPLRVQRFLVRLLKYDV